LTRAFISSIQARIVLLLVIVISPFAKKANKM